MIVSYVLDRDLNEDPIVSRLSKFIGKDLSGEDFNQLFADIEFVKMTNSEEKHKTIQYGDGLNIDTEEFKPSMYIDKGGMYFTTKKYAHIWLYYGDQLMSYMRKVTIPNDARIFIKDYATIKTDKFILDRRIEIDEDIYKKFVHKAQTYYIKPVLEILKTENKLKNLTFLRDKTEWLKLIDRLGSLCGGLLVYIPEEIVDNDICIKAIKNDEHEILYIPEFLKNKEFYMNAAKINGKIIGLIPKEFIDKDMCIEAVKSRKNVLASVPKEFRDNDVCRTAIKKDGESVRHIPENLINYRELCIEAIKNDCDVIMSIPRHMLTSNMLMTCNEVWDHLMTD